MLAYKFENGSIEESCQADEQRPQLDVLPEQTICECGHIVDKEDQHRCVHCLREGCGHCMQKSQVDTLGDPDWVCDTECEIAWYEELAEAEQATHEAYQRYIAELAHAAREKEEAA